MMMVGGHPSVADERRGRPFAGPPGRLLDLALTSLGIAPGSVYMANVIKCRTPSDRDPFAEEADSCLPYLRAQFTLVRPEIIVCLGEFASKRLMGPDFSFHADRGVWSERKGVRMAATFHPADAVRGGSVKEALWLDLKGAKALLSGQGPGGQAK